MLWVHPFKNSSVKNDCNNVVTLPYKSYVHVVHAQFCLYSITLWLYGWWNLLVCLPTCLIETVFLYIFPNNTSLIDNFFAKTSLIWHFENLYFGLFRIVILMFKFKISFPNRIISGQFIFVTEYYLYGDNTLYLLSRQNISYLHIWAS